MLPLLALALATSAPARAADAVISLVGPWDFALDSSNEGLASGWAGTRFKETIRLPGCLQEQGFGEIPGPETKWWAGWGEPARLTPDFPFLEKYNRPDGYRITAFLQPDRHYIGAAWYGREVRIPSDWSDKRLVLFLERCHWETRLWVDGQEVGSRDGLGVPHEYDVTRWLPPGKHYLVLRVDNGRIVEVGGNPHSVSDQTAGAWNGVVGRMELRAGPPLWLEDLQVYPHVATRSVTVKGRIGESRDRSGQGRVLFAVTCENKASAPSQTLDVAWSPGGGEFTCELALGEDAPLWDEFLPALHRLTATLSHGLIVAERAVTFGLREFRVAGTQFALNGRPVFLRGNVDCAVFPQSGYAPMTVEAWRATWRIYKAWGFNMARFHSWCPPEAAFVAADEAGILLAPECGEWSSVKSPEQEAFFQRESLAMLQRYGNHPSFVMMALGNEMGGDKALFSRLLAGWKKDSRRVYSIKANSRSNPPECDYEVVREQGGVRIRYQGGWPPKPLNTLLQSRPPQTTADWREGVAKASKPLIAHETGQFCSYPDVIGEPRKFTGWLKPAYLDIARDELVERGMLDQVPDFVRASGLWQMELYKEEIEAHLRTPGLAGFSLLQLNDFSGQGTAPVGLLDATWSVKPYARSDYFRQFCGPTVPLARMEKRVWTSDETFAAKIEVTHYGATPLPSEEGEAVVRDSSGNLVMHAQWRAEERGLGTAQPLGHVSLPLGGLDAPGRFSLHVTLPSAGVSNQWNFWVYPAALPPESPSEVLIAHSFDAAAQTRLASGGRVLLLPRRSELAGHLPMCFTTFYWTTFAEQGGQSSACGLLCDPKHPAFRDFPTDFHADWQWWELLTEASPMILDEPGRTSPWPKEYRPTVQMIDGWKLNRKLAVFAEARVGQGRLAICSMDIEKDLASRPVARQFRHSLLRYLDSAAFNPPVGVTPAMVQALFSKQRSSLLRELNAGVWVSSAQERQAAEYLIDGDPSTFWQTRLADNSVPPHWIAFDLKQTMAVKGLRYLPRQDRSIGRIADFAVHISADGKKWGVPVVEGRWSDSKDEQEIHFPSLVKTRFLKLEIRSEVGRLPSGAAAEIDIVVPDSLPTDG